METIKMTKEEVLLYKFNKLGIEPIDLLASAQGLYPRLPTMTMSILGGGGGQLERERRKITRQFTS